MQPEEKVLNYLDFDRAVDIIVRCDVASSGLSFLSWTWNYFKNLDYEKNKGKL